MATDEEALALTLRKGLTRAITMIGINPVRVSFEDVLEILYGSPLIQHIIDSQEFSRSSFDFLENRLVREYLINVKGGDQINDKEPLLLVFQELVRRIDKIKDVDQAIDQIIQEIITILKTKEFHLKVFTILQNFTSDIEFQIPGEPSVMVRKFSYSEENQFRGLIENATSLGDGYVQGGPGFYIAEIEFDRLLCQSLIDDCHRIFERLHWYLKLCSSTPVSIASIFFVPQGYTWHPFHCAMAERHSEIKSVNMVFDPSTLYHVNADLSSELIDLAKEFPKLFQCLPDKSQRRFRLAMERYIDADSNPQYGIVDLVIAFESLLLPGINSELKFRLAQRTALLIGKNPTDRINIFNMMKKVYNERSRIAHGEKPNKNTNNDSDLLQTAREYLRKVLLSMLRRTESDLGAYFDQLALQ